MSYLQSFMQVSMYIAKNSEGAFLDSLTSCQDYYWKEVAVTVEMLCEGKGSFEPGVHQNTAFPASHSDKSEN